MFNLDGVRIDEKATWIDLFPDPAGRWRTGHRAGVGRYRQAAADRRRVDGGRPGGGGITPWAVIGSNASADEVGGSVSISRLKTKDYGLTSYGAALGFRERFELSVGEQDFNAGPAVALNGLGFSVANGQHIKMTVLGAKVRVAGDAVLDSDTLMPQIALGMEYKSTDAGTIRPVLDFLHAKTTGTDLYASATKLLLAQGILLNATLRY